MRNVLLSLRKHRINKHSILKLCLSASLLLFAVSCRTVPQNADMESSAALLPEGSDVIIRADLEKNLELIEPVLALFSNLPPELTGEFLERTETLWAGLDFDTRAPTDDSWMPSPTFNSSIVARGDFPDSIIEWGLCWDAGWKKENYKPIPEENMRLPYWYEKEGVNQISVPNDNYLFASSGSIEEMIGNWSSQTQRSVSREWIESEQTADVSIMTRNLSQEDYGLFIPQFKRVPLESLILSLVRADDEYLISGRFHMDSEVSAFLFATLFRTMVISAKDENGVKLFENPRDISIKKDGSDVVLDGMLLPAANVAAVEAGWLSTAGLKQ